MVDGPDTTTGALVRYVPDGPVRDELLYLVRLGIKFEQQHRGRRPGFLRRYVAGIVWRMESPTFEMLLDELELEATRRDLNKSGKGLPPIETVNRVWQLVKYHDPKRGEVQVTFGTLRNIFTAAKRTEFIDSPKP